MWLLLAYFRSLEILGNSGLVLVEDIGIEGDLLVCIGLSSYTLGGLDGEQHGLYSYCLSMAVGGGKPVIVR